MPHQKIQTPQTLKIPAVTLSQEIIPMDILRITARNMTAVTAEIIRTIRMATVTVIMKITVTATVMVIMETITAKITDIKGSCLYKNC